MIHRWVGILALGVAQAVFAQAPAPEGSGNVPPELVQKQEFARRLVEDPSLLRRIQASQDAEARRLFAFAQDSYAGALAALQRRDLIGAEKQFNEIVSAIGKLRRRVPDTEAIAARQRADYERLLESVQSLEKSCFAYLKRAKLPSAAGSDETAEGARSEMVKLVEAAKRDAGDNRMGDALSALEKAEQVMKSALGRILGTVAIEYAPKFESPLEEYNLELERNRSYLELIPVAITELKPNEEVRQTIESLVEQAQASVDLAREYAKLQDYRKALANVRAGTGYLRLALTAAGLVLPRGQGAE